MEYVNVVFNIIWVTSFDTNFMKLSQAAAEDQAISGQKWSGLLGCSFRIFIFHRPKIFVLKARNFVERADPVHISLPFNNLFLNLRSVLWRVEIRANIYIWLCCNTGLCHVKNKNKTFLVISFIEAVKEQSRTQWIHSMLLRDLYSEIILVLVQPVLYYGLKNVMHAVSCETLS